MELRMEAALTEVLGSDILDALTGDGASLGLE
jgi:hypothetical protein